MLALRTGSRLAVLCCNKQRPLIQCAPRCEPKLGNHLIWWMRDRTFMWPSCGYMCTGCRGKHTKCAVATSWAGIDVRLRSRAAVTFSNAIGSGTFINCKQESMVLRDSCWIGRIERMHSILREVRSLALGPKDSGHVEQVEPVGDSLGVETLCTDNMVK